MRSLFLVLALVVVANAGGMPKKMVKEVMAIKFMKGCWGEKLMGEFFDGIESAYAKCSKQAPEYTVTDLFGAESNRVTRQTTSDSDEDDHMAKFIESMQMVKQQKVEGISNLTCVAKEMKMWKEDNSINIDQYTGEFLKEAPFKPELKEMFRKGYKTCYKLSEALPVEEMQNPMKRMFGKQQFFQKCVLKTEASLCAMKEIHDYMEMKYGEFTEEKAEKMGLPKNEYEAAVIAKMVKKHTMASSKKFVMTAIMTGSPMI